MFRFFCRRSKLGASFFFVAVFFRAAGSGAEPLRLRGDVLAQTSSPVGLLVLRGEDRRRPWLDVETVAWVGATRPLHVEAQGLPDQLVATGDVLTLSVRARDLATGSEIRAGRMLVSMGAVRPLHVDGARGLARAFGSTTFEAFGGVPVVQRFEVDGYDWAAGGRIGQAIGHAASFGGSYALHRRSTGRDREEAGADMALTPTPWLTAAGRTAFDVVSRGLTDALVSISVQDGDTRGEVFTTHRSAGRLLPATSLFSVLGDFAATSTGGTFRWRAFPRLELITTGSVQVQGEQLGGQGLGRATLALDDDWAGSVGLEARRVDFGASRWSGVRAIGAWPLGAALRLATELELVRPDEASDRGALWPWGLGAVSWRSESGWEVAAAVEASAGPQYRESLQALARISYALGEPPAPRASR